MLGYHVSKGKYKSMEIALAAAADNLSEYGFARPCAQIFVSGPQSFRQNLTDEDIVKCCKVATTRGLNLVIHGAYVDHPWNRAQGAVHNIKQELQVAAKLGATGVIVHLGAGAANDASLETVLKAVGDLPEKVLDRVILWLEINAAKPTDATYETPEKITRLFERVHAVGSPLRVGLCIDTAHLYSCGIALDSMIAARRWLEGLPNVPIMLHLNDSASLLGSGIDRHQTLLEGNIWKDYHPVTGDLAIEDSGLIELVNYAERNNIMVVLERNDDGLAPDLVLLQQLGYFQ